MLRPQGQLIKVFKMLHLLGLALLGSLLLAAETSATALDDDRDPQNECTADNAVALSFSNLGRNYRALAGDCVTVEGIGWNDAVYEDLPSLYRHNTGSSKSIRGIVGLTYPAIRWESAAPKRVSVTGKIVDCAADKRAFRRSQRAIQRQKSDNDEIILIHHYGFCASNNGVALRVFDHSEMNKLTLQRLTSDSDRKAFGDLLFAPADFLQGANIGELRRALLQISCRNNGSYDSSETGLNIHPPVGTTELLIPARFCDDGKIVEGANIAEQFFTISKSAPYQDSDSDLDFVYCICREASCESKWPIALIDAAWHPDRPFLCHRVERRPRTISYDENGRVIERGNWFYEVSRDAGLYWLDPDALLSEPR